MHVARRFPGRSQLVRSVTFCACPSRRLPRSVKNSLPPRSFGRSSGVTEALVQIALEIGLTVGRARDNPGSGRRSRFSQAGWRIWRHAGSRHEQTRGELAGKSSCASRAHEGPPSTLLVPLLPEVAVHQFFHKLHALEFQQLRVLFRRPVQRHADLPGPRENTSDLRWSLRSAMTFGTARV